MPNYSRQTLFRIGRLLNAKGDGAHLQRLAEWGGFSRKSLHNWTLDESDPQHRAMPPSAKRMVALLAYFGMTGMLNEQRMKDILALEALLERDEQVQALLPRVSRLLQSLRPAEEAEGGEADATEVTAQAA
jgi:hypothetical protein